VNGYLIGSVQLSPRESSKLFSTRRKRLFKTMPYTPFAKKRDAPISMIAGPVVMQHS
jgi:hypothetical protein